MDKPQCWFFLGIEALNEEGAEYLTEVVEFYEFCNPYDAYAQPELSNTQRRLN